jgi:hypothetical protein
MRNLLLSSAMLLGLCAPAFAQVNAVPQVGLTTGYLPKVTYSSAFFGLVPGASATDVVCIAASATKTVRVQRITIGGTGTAISLPIQLVRRASLDTGGTAGTTTANPGVTTQITSRDTGLATNASASATLISYTAVPTINDSSPVYVDSALLGVVATTVGTPTPLTVFDYAYAIEDNLQVPTLAKGSTQQICVNFGGVSTTSSLTGQITWTEE